MNVAHVFNCCSMYAHFFYPLSHILLWHVMIFAWTRFKIESIELASLLPLTIPLPRPRPCRRPLKMHFETVARFRTYMRNTGVHTLFTSMDCVSFVMLFSRSSRLPLWLLSTRRWNACRSFQCHHPMVTSFLPAVLPTSYALGTGQPPHLYSQVAYCVWWTVSMGDTLGLIPEVRNSTAA